LNRKTGKIDVYDFFIALSKEGHPLSNEEKELIIKELKPLETKEIFLNQFIAFEKEYFRKNRLKTLRSKTLDLMTELEKSLRERKDKSGEEKKILE